MKSILPEFENNSSTLSQSMAHTAQLLLLNGYGLNEGSQFLRGHMILQSLQQTRGNACKTAVQLQIHRNSLSRTIAQLRLGRRINEIRVAARARFQARRNPIAELSYPLRDRAGAA